MRKAPGTIQRLAALLSLFLVSQRVWKIVRIAGNLAAGGERLA
jgi:hypothetical protein